jgi:caffeoyl-CoA O-methyltransferase
MIVDRNVEEYALQASTSESAVQARLAAAVRASSPASGMMVGPVEGRLLHLLAHLVGAKRVLEIGTFGGYSALFFSSAVGEDGEVITLEASPEHARMARQNLAEAGATNVTVLEGDAKDLLNTLSPHFDLVFIDADKSGYPFYVEKALELVSPTGLVVLDNTLLGGRVLKPEDDDAKVMDQLNRRLAQDAGLEVALLSVRDGVTLVRKRGDCDG